VGEPIEPAVIHPVELADVLDPTMSGCMLPAAAYCDDRVLAWERSNLFAGAWVCAGRSAELDTPGTRVAVAVADDQVVLVRGTDGVLRGFFNACRHRAHELMACGATDDQRSIQCPYHGWRYGLDGALLSTPHFEAPDGFDRSLHGLTPVAVEEWHGWAMVDVTGSAPPLHRFLDGLEARIGPYEPERLTVGGTHTYEIAANWKLIVENYQECVHCPRIHPELCAVSPAASGENHTGHDGMWVGGWQDLRPHADTMSLSGASGGVMLRGLDDLARRRIDYLGLLPNLLVSLHPDYVMTHLLHPVAADRTAIECQWLFDPRAAARDDFDPSYAIDFWDITNRQDWAACEAVQRGVGSRGYRPGPFAADEDTVASFTRLIAHAYLHGSLPIS
jgi:Rieske 2Fe-2S family protein